MRPKAQLQFGRVLLQRGKAPLAGLFAGSSDRLALGAKVYANTVIHGLVSALQESFPGVRHLAGDERFTGLALAYIRVHPPQRRALIAGFGAAFADFIDDAANVPCGAALADLARLEWAWLACYHAADAQPLPLTALAGLSAEALAQARFDFQPALHLITSPHDLAALWACGREAAAAPASWAGASALALVRDDFTIRLLPHPPGIHAGLEALAAGQTFAQAQGLVADGDAFLAALVTLIQSGALIAITLPETAS